METTPDILAKAIEAAARALMDVRARRPADPTGPEHPILDMDPDFDDLPLDATQGTDEDPITQEAVLALARSAVLAALPYVMEPPDAEIAGLKHDLEKYMGISADLATENTSLLKALADIGQALGINPPSATNAGHELVGVHSDLMRGRNDKVVWGTIERVVKQLAKVEAILKQER